MHRDPDGPSPAAPGMRRGAERRNGHPGRGTAAGRLAGRPRRSPWPWRLAATAASVVFFGGMTVVLPVPDGDRGATGAPAAVDPAGEAGAQAPAYGSVIQEERGPWPGGEVQWSPGGPVDLPGWPGGPAHTKTRPS
ncbi:hypothetical protein Tmar_2144 [Thermaerobacter marianensis DSM 12885]|uniref:Uncharacterized protein n=1 Tax=Thermaerobacter marianensis (strain ATCC 700841 / DSM 12885 / JCM 10246 / 7p75a) TaxID=644966 RepID=E6SJZ2_THEM7|nr:hypothetical protein [Thermaerobacter marianensis]ADU52225.1 hypothetical protein Tmar_2144 [Thermaerobacter marianensis DSM 12885]